MYNSKFQMTIECDDGRSIELSAIKSSDPQKFAIELIRQVKGIGYLKRHICEPTKNTRSEKDPMDSRTIKQIKGELVR